MSVDRPRPLVAGNWKMNGLKGSAKVLEEIHAGYTPGLKAKVDLAVCPPATLIGLLAKRAIGSRIAIGGQDCHAKASGAYHGRPLGRDAGRCRRDLCASSAIPSGGSTMARPTRTSAPRRTPRTGPGLTAIVCVGETREEREAGQDARRGPRAAARLDPGRIRTAATWWWPTSPSGPSAPA